MAREQFSVWQQEAVETSEFVWLKSVACLGEERSEREREEEDEGEWRLLSTARTILAAETSGKQ